jgi:hypothetical protein
MRHAAGRVVLLLALVALVACARPSPTPPVAAPYVFIP